MSRGRGATAMVVALSLSMATSASASTEIGSTCQANREAFNGTLVQLYTRQENPVPISAPADGVITSWRVDIGSAGSLPVELKVLEPGGFPNDWHVVAESAVATLRSGENVIESRIPIKAGDRLGLYGPDGQTPYCESAFAQDVVGYSVGNAETGSTKTFTMETGAQLPVSARIESDADGDGYGDETQDGCPQNPAAHSGCQSTLLPSPLVLLEASPVVRKRSILLLIGVSSAAQVHVYGQVGWGFKPKRGERGSERLIVGLNGGTQSLVPGQIGRFVLRLPKAVRHRLAQIGPKRELKARITAKAGVAGTSTPSTMTVKLRGTGDKLAGDGRTNHVQPAGHPPERQLRQS